MQPRLKGITCALAMTAALQIEVPVAVAGSRIRLVRPDCAGAFTATVASGDPAPHVRSTNSRIQEVLRYALAKSESFRDLLATLDLVDRVVYVEEGTCRNPEHRSCLSLVADSPNIIVHIDPRQQNPFGRCAARARAVSRRRNRPGA